MTMRRSLVPAAAISAGLCALVLTACTPRVSSVGAASADRTAEAGSRGAGRMPTEVPAPAAPATSPVPNVHPLPAVNAPATPTANQDVISENGTHGIRIGQTLEELTAAGKMAPQSPGCARHFASFTYADPVFDHGRMAFIWAYPPLHTPEGVMVGTRLDEVRSAYPGAERLIPPSGSTTFDGTLVPHPNGVAYLILHDTNAVQKLIVGQEDAVRMLYTHRLDTC